MEKNGKKTVIVFGLGAAGTDIKTVRETMVVKAGEGVGKKTEKTEWTGRMRIDSKTGKLKGVYRMKNRKPKPSQHLTEHHGTVAPHHTPGDLPLDNSRVQQGLYGHLIKLVGPGVVNEALNRVFGEGKPSDQETRNKFLIDATALASKKDTYTGQDAKQTIASLRASDDGEFVGHLMDVLKERKAGKSFRFDAGHQEYEANTVTAHLEHGKEYDVDGEKYTYTATGSHPQHAGILHHSDPSKQQTHQWLVGKVEGTTKGQFGRPVDSATISSTEDAANAILGHDDAPDDLMAGVGKKPTGALPDVSKIELPEGYDTEADKPKMSANNFETMPDAKAKWKVGDGWTGEHDEVGAALAHISQFISPKKLAELHTKAYPNEPAHSETDMKEWVNAGKADTDVKESYTDAEKLKLIDDLHSTNYHSMADAIAVSLGTNHGMLGASDNPIPIGGKKVVAYHQAKAGDTVTHEGEEHILHAKNKRLAGHPDAPEVDHLENKATGKHKVISDWNYFDSGSEQSHSGTDVHHEGDSHEDAKSRYHEDNHPAGSWPRIGQKFKANIAKKTQSKVREFEVVEVHGKEFYARTKGGSVLHKFKRIPVPHYGDDKYDKDGETKAPKFDNLWLGSSASKSMDKKTTLKLGSDYDPHGFDNGEGGETADDQKYDETGHPKYKKAMQLIPGSEVHLDSGSQHGDNSKYVVTHVIKPGAIPGVNDNDGTTNQKFGAKGNPHLIFKVKKKGGKNIHELTVYPQGYHRISENRDDYLAKAHSGIFFTFGREAKHAGGVIKNALSRVIKSCLKDEKIIKKKIAETSTGKAISVNQHGTLAWEDVQKFTSAERQETVRILRRIHERLVADGYGKHAETFDWAIEELEREAEEIAAGVRAKVK